MNITKNESAEKNRTVRVKKEDGSEIVCTVLYTAENETDGKKYLVAADDTVDENGKTKIYSGVYEIKDGEPVLQTVLNDKDRFNINTILDILEMI